MTKAKPVRRPARPAPKPRTMPRFTKAPTALADLFQRALAGLPDVQSRRMFGYPAGFTRNQVFASLFQDKMIVRLSEADRAALAGEGGRAFEPMPGRPMREYLVVPEPVRESPSALHAWLTKAQAYAASLPPKKKR